MTLSITVMVSKLFTTWKVRAMPRSQRSAAGSAVTSSPSNMIEPCVGGSTPAIRLNSVDLPAPLGPISPTISPRPTEIETSLLAIRPPNRCQTPLVSQQRRHRTAPLRRPENSPTSPSGRASEISTISVP